MTKAELFAEFVAKGWSGNCSADESTQETIFEGWLTDCKMAGYITETNGDFEKTSTWPQG